jgi:enamine deaminase RidA (YjgF/YER057c/UK114 family)
VALERRNPTELHQPTGYSQVVVASGKRMVFVAGQVAVDPQGKVVGRGDLGAQAKQAFRNVVSALKSAGAGPSDVAKITWYVVNYSETVRPTIVAARGEVFGEHTPASTLIGVQALASPDYLIEVEAIAVLD